MSSYTYFCVAQREAAIVTPIPGTTRDILELSLDIGGLPVIVADTAGLRKTDDVVESIGVDRAKTLSVLHTCRGASHNSLVYFRVKNCDIAICVLSASEVLVQSDGNDRKLNLPTDIAPLVKEDTLLLLNKIDLLPDSQTPSMCLPWNAWTCSLNTGEGTRAFIEGFGKTLQQQ